MESFSRFAFRVVEEKAMPALYSRAGPRAFLPPTRPSDIRSSDSNEIGAYRGGRNIQYERLTGNGGWALFEGDRSRAYGSRSGHERGNHQIAADVDRRPAHVEKSLHAENQAHALGRDADRLREDQHHRQR